MGISEVALKDNVIVAKTGGRRSASKTRGQDPRMRITSIRMGQKGGVFCPPLTC
jgi:hypothetical protein